MIDEICHMECEYLEAQLDWISDAGKHKSYWQLG
jgi:hypothetical protein